MFSRSSTNVTIKSSIQKQYQIDTANIYRHERNQYSEILLNSNIGYGVGRNSNEIQLRKDIKPILLSLSTMIKQFNTENNNEYQLLKNKIINIEKIIVSLQSILNNNIKESGSNNGLSIINKILFKRTSLFNRIQYGNQLQLKSKQESGSFQFPFDWYTEYRINSDYHFKLPINVYLYIIEKLNLFDSYTTINNNIKNIIINDKLHQFISSINSKNNGIDDINRILIYGLFKMVFSNNNDININNKSQLLELIISNDNFIGLVEKDLKFQFQFTISYLNFLIGFLSNKNNIINNNNNNNNSSNNNNNIIINNNNNNNTTTQPSINIIQFLESFYNILFIKWDSKSLQIYPSIISSRILKLHNILNENKFQNGTIGLLNFKLYSFLNNGNGNDKFKINQQQNNKEITSIKIKKNENQKFYNPLYEIGNLFNSNGLCNGDIEGIKNLLIKLLDLSDKESVYLIQLKQIVNISIWIPFHLIENQDINNNQELEQSLSKWYQDLIVPIIENYNFENAVLEIENMSYILFYLSSVSSSSSSCKKVILHIIDKLIVSWFLPSFSKITDNFGLLKDLLNLSTESDILKRIQSIHDQQQSSLSISNILIRSLNKLTLVQQQLEINDQEHKENNKENEETFEDIEPQIRIDQQENEKIIIQDLKLVCFLDSNYLIDSFLKSILKNKGQSGFFIDLIYKQLSSVIIGNVDKFLMKSFSKFILNQYGTIGELQIYNFIKFFNRVVDYHFQCNSEPVINIIDNMFIEYVLNEFVSNTITNLHDKKSHSIDIHQIDLIFQVLKLVIDKFNNQNNNNNNNNNKYISIDLLDSIIWKLLDFINYQFQIVIDSISHVSFVQSFYQVLEILANKINCQNGINGNEGLILINNNWSIFKKLNWKLQFRIYNYYCNNDSNNSNNGTMFINCKIQDLLSMESNWNIEKSNLNYKFKELYEISNLIEICCISNKCCTEIISLIRNDIDIGIGMELFSNRNKFQKLFLITCSNLLPFSPSNYFSILINTILPLLIKNNLIGLSSSSNQDININQEKSLFLLKLLKVYLLNQNNNLNGNNSIYFFKQISNIYQQLFFNQEGDETPNIQLFNLQVCLNSVYLLLKNNFIQQVELFFIISLSLISNLKKSNNHGGQEIKLHLSNCKLILNDCLKLFENTTNNNNQIYDKLNTCLNKLNDF